MDKVIHLRGGAVLFISERESNPFDPKKRPEKENDELEFHDTTFQKEKRLDVSRRDKVERAMNHRSSSSRYGSKSHRFEDPHKRDRKHDSIRFGK